MKFGMRTTSLCYSPAPSLLGLCSHPASSQFFPYSCLTHSMLLPCNFPVLTLCLPSSGPAPTQFHHSFCPALLYSA